jgi:hypothetical protein
MRTGIEINFSSRYMVRKQHLLNADHRAGLRKQLSRESFSEYAVGSPMDTKIVHTWKWALAKQESFRSEMGTWQSQLAANVAATIIEGHEFDYDR